MRPPLALLVLALVAGCAAPELPVAREMRLGDDAGPGELAFSAPVVVSRVPPGHVTAEPSLAIADDGTIVVAAPYRAACAVTLHFEPIVVDCGWSRAWRSTDGGATFHGLGDAEGRLVPGQGGGGDADVVTLPNGRAVLVDLDTRMGLRTYLSPDAGDTWTPGPIVRNGANGFGDRPWLAARADGRILLVWGNTSGSGFVDLVASDDGGVSYGPRQRLASTYETVGPTHLAADGTTLIPYVDRETGVRLLRSVDAGASWADLDTGARPVPSPGATPADGHGRRTLLFPVAVSDAAGAIHVAWSEAKENASRVWLTTSTDAGSTWGPPTPVTPPGAQAVFPWLVAGDAGRFALLHLAADTPGDPNVGAHAWRLRAAISLDGGASFQSALVSPEVVHVGSICSNGAGCGYPFTPLVNDRALLDFFEATLTPAGDLAVTWTKVPLEEGRQHLLQYARQTGGGRLVSAP